MKSSKLLRRLLVSLMLMCAAIAAHSQPNTWAFKSHMPDARYDAAAATGPDGRIYLTGGTFGLDTAANSTASCFVYDPSTDTFTPIADMPFARSQHACVTGADGLIYVFGGSTFVNGGIPNEDAWTSTIAYDPSTNTWSTKASLPNLFVAPCGARAKDGHIFAFNGHGSGPTDSKEAYFDVSANSWTKPPTAPPDAFGFLNSAVAHANGNIYVFGGRGTGDDHIVYAYSPSADVWTTVAPLSMSRGGQTGAIGGDGNIYCIGGFDNVSASYLSLTSAYNPASNAWTDVASMNVARAGLASATGMDGRIYVFGGANDSGVLDSVECYTPSLLSVNGTGFSATEGTAYNGTVATFHDADTTQGAGNFSATIKWGDGTASAGSIVAGGSPGDFSVTGSHTYADSGSMVTEIDIVDSDGESGDATGAAYVADADLSGSAKNISPYTNVSFTGTVATFTDGNSLGTAPEFQAGINWGDGTISGGTVFANPAGGFTVSGTHTYTVSGSYSTTIVVADTGGTSSLSVSGVATVMPSPPVVSMSSLNAVEGAAFNGQVATFTDVDQTLVASNFSASIDWGDGSVTSGAIASNGSGFKVTGDHTYAEEGTYTVTVTVTTGGSSGNSSALAHVADASLTAVGYSLIEKGTTFSDTVATFTDADPAGTATDFTAGIVWGDGKSSNGTIVAFGSGWKVVGSHSYLKRGKYTVTIHIKDAGGATATATTLINVGPVK